MIHIRRTYWRLFRGLVLAFAIAVFHPGAVVAEELNGEALVAALRDGGYNIYFRHAPTNWRLQDKVRNSGDWTSCDPDEMRQLSDDGRATARRIGKAIRALGIPVGKVLSSEYCRAAETAQLMNLGPVETTRDIMNMRAAEFVGGRQAVVRRARRVLSTPPPAGTNAVIVGHGNLMRAATDAYTDEAGSGVYEPGPRGEPGFVLIGRLSASDWTDLAAHLADSD